MTAGGTGRAMHRVTRQAGGTSWHDEGETTRQESIDMTTGNQRANQDQARIRINIEAAGEEFRIQVYSGHAQTTKGDRALFLTFYKVMNALMEHPARTKTVRNEDGTVQKVVPKTKSGKRFPTRFPFTTRKK